MNPKVTYWLRNNWLGYVPINEYIINLQTILLDKSGNNGLFLTAMTKELRLSSIIPQFVSQKWLREICFTVVFVLNTPPPFKYPSLVKSNFQNIASDALNLGRWVFKANTTIFSQKKLLLYNYYRIFH